jgi:hypothetical protein
MMLAPTPRENGEAVRTLISIVQETVAAAAETQALLGAS